MEKECEENFLPEVHFSSAINHTLKMLLITELYKWKKISYPRIYYFLAASLHFPSLDFVTVLVLGHGFIFLFSIKWRDSWLHQRTSKGSREYAFP